MVSSSLQHAPLSPHAVAGNADLVGDESLKYCNALCRQTLDLCLPAILQHLPQLEAEGKSGKHDMSSIDG